MTETWLLNNAIPIGSASDDFTGLSFVSNNNSYDRIYFERVNFEEAQMYYYAGSNRIQVYYVLDGGVSWTDQAYRTISFNTAPTGNLLTWLQTNGTKQPLYSKSLNRRYNSLRLRVPTSRYLRVSGKI